MLPKWLTLQHHQRIYVLYGYQSCVLHLILRSLQISTCYHSSRWKWPVDEHLIETRNPKLAPVSHVDRPDQCYGTFNPTMSHIEHIPVSVSNAVKVIEWCLYVTSIMLAGCRFGVHMQNKTTSMFVADMWLGLAVVNCTALIACDTATYRANEMSNFISPSEHVRRVRVLLLVVHS